MWKNKAFSRTLSMISARNPELAQKLDTQNCVVQKADLEGLIELAPSMIIVMNCRESRFLCPVKYASHFIAIIDEHRDMSSKKYGPKNFMNISDVVMTMMLQRQ
jgi:hypothetical protein